MSMTLQSDAMQEMLIYFAKKSRVDSRSQLMARMVHHSFDSRNQPMSEALAKLFLQLMERLG